MNVTLKECIVIYTRATMRLFGARAREKTQERMEHLREIGDLEGAVLHGRVRDCIAQIDQQKMTVERQNRVIL